MFRVRLNNFRCFVDSGDIEIRPITFLVGENSAGKTTFLAGLRYLLESLSRGSQNPFNRDPYYLGGFDQIAHYRRGKVGRAKQFSLSLTVPAQTLRRKPGIAEQNITGATSHKFVFSKGAVQPDLNEYIFSASGIRLVVDLVSELRATLSEEGREDLTIVPKKEHTLPLEVYKRDMSFLLFVLQSAFTDGRKELSEEEKGIINRLVQTFSESIRIARKTVFASSPVRTQPLRTYTPSEINASSEGAHVPLEMARQKIGDPEVWQKAHERMANFGKHSGLFEDIDIRRLGRSDGDPFQVVVRGNGPPVNIVDVGYGVSQALPIIYQLEEARTNDVFLLQQPEVHLHPRAQAEIGTMLARLSKSRPNNLYAIETHSDYIIDRIRMKVASGALNKDQVTIAYFEKAEHEVKAQNLYLSEKGEILNPPDSFREFFLHEQARLLGL